MDDTLTKAGYAADAKAAGDAIGGKIDKAQGVENAGMILGVDEDGKVVPSDPNYLPGFVSYSRYQGLTYEQQEHAKQNIGAGTLRHVVYWDKSTSDTDENPNSAIGCASKGQTCICAGYGFLPQGMTGPVLVIYGTIERGYIDATAFDGSNATWTFTVNLRDYSYSTPIKKSGIPIPATAQVGQIVKVKSVDADGKVTETEAVNMPSGGSYTLPVASPTALGGVKPIAKTDAMTQGVGVDAEGALWTAPYIEGYELVFTETIAEDVASYTRTTDTDGNTFDLTDILVIIFTKPFAESTNKVGRKIGCLPTSRWGMDELIQITDTIKSGGTEVGCYDVVYAKVIDGYQVSTRYYRSQNYSSVFGAMQERTGAGETGIQFYTDATKLMQINRPQGNFTCLKIVGYVQQLIAAGTIISLYKRKGT